MFLHTAWGVALVTALSRAGLAAAQTAPSPDLRTLSLRSLHAGRTIRVAGRDIGTITGPVAGVHDGVLWLGVAPGRSVPLAGIDSVWVSRGHAGTGAIVGSLIGAVVGIAAMSGKSCDFADTGCVYGAAFGATGIMLGGALLGAIIGDGAKSWQLRYP